MATTRKKVTKKATKKKAAKVTKAPSSTEKRAAPTPAQEEELEHAIREFCELKNRLDALEEMIDLRKKRVDLLMSKFGLSRREVEGCGSASFSERRTFKVINPDRLAELMSPRQLAALAHVTADVYDAAVLEKVDIGEAVVVGRTPSLTIKRSQAKLARQRQMEFIKQARKAAEARIEDKRAEWREAARA